MDDNTGFVPAMQKAQARAIIRVNSPAIIGAILANQIPTGNVLEIAKTAGLFAIKNTHAVIPGCFSKSIEHAQVEFFFEKHEIQILVSVKTISKGGVALEAMHGASVVALTVFDLLKELDSEICIKEISLVDEWVGNSTEQLISQKKVRAAVIVCSTAIFEGRKIDSAGKVIVRMLDEFQIEVGSYELVEGKADAIRNRALDLAGKVNILILSGGTGLTSKDLTPDAIAPILEKRIPGMEEAMRRYGQNITPYAMISRSMAGMIGNCLALVLPGSTRGAKESMEAIFPYALKVFSHQGMPDL